MTDLGNTVSRPLRVGVYARVSTSDQTCEQQLQALREYTTARHWHVQGEYVDAGVSGTKDSRPAMNKLLEAARKRQVDAIVCWKLDRWGRSMAHFVSSVQELRTLGVRFVAVTQNIDTDESNPTARLMLNLLAAFAEFERELIVERTRAGLLRARRAGRIGGRPRKVFDRQKALELRQEGRSIAQIAEAMGVPKTTVYDALKGPAMPPTGTVENVQADVVSALLNLGCKQAAAERAVRLASGVTFEELFRDALRTVA